MNIGLVDVDGHNFPNLALMKLAAWHKAQGDFVKWLDPLFDTPDRVYASKVFTFTPDYNGAWPRCEIIKGGTGYDIKRKLPAAIEYMQPDYSLYPQFDFALGFLTRGCSRNCAWCIVPKKEGYISAYMDIEQIAIRKKVVLLDNNVLAHSYGIQQIEKISKMDIRIDFNQGMDARLITLDIAQLLCACKWIRYIRISCDTLAMLEAVETAINNIRKFKPTLDIWCYLLVKDIPDALTIARRLKELNITVFAQGYRDFNAEDNRTQEQIKFCSWVNRNKRFHACDFENYNRSKQAALAAKTTGLENLL